MFSPLSMAWLSSTLFSKVKLYSKPAHSIFFILRQTNIEHHWSLLSPYLVITESTAVAMYCSSVSVVSLVMKGNNLIINVTLSYLEERMKLTPSSGCLLALFTPGVLLGAGGIR